MNIAACKSLRRTVRCAGLVSLGIFLAAPIYTLPVGSAGSRTTTAPATDTTTQTAESKARERAERWDKAIRKFEKHDETTAPIKNGILFVGSSSIVGWDVDKSFPDLPVLNRGFGGSQVSDVLQFFDRVVVPYEPRIVVLYSGDNDISGGKSPETVAAHMKEFVELVEKKVPSARKVIIIPPKPSISRFKLWPEMKRVSELMQEFARTNDKVVVVDMADGMMGEDGQPRKELFKKDNLHLSPAGYDVWNAKLAPHLKMD